MAVHDELTGRFTVEMIDVDISLPTRDGSPQKILQGEAVHTGTVPLGPPPPTKTTADEFPPLVLEDRRLWRFVPMPTRLALSDRHMRGARQGGPLGQGLEGALTQECKAGEADSWWWLVSLVLLATGL